MPANMVAESTVSISTWIPTSARFCWIKAARLARWLVQARVKVSPSYPAWASSSLAPFRVVGALPCWPGSAPCPAGMLVLVTVPREPVFCWHSSSLSRAFSMAWRRVGAVHRLVVDHQFIEGAGHRPLPHGEAGLLRHGAVLFRDAPAEGVVVQVPGNEGGEEVCLVHHGDGEGVKPWGPPAGSPCWPTAPGCCRKPRRRTGRGRSPRGSARSRW